MKINEAYENLTDSEKRRRYRFQQENLSSLAHVLNNTSPLFQNLFRQATQLWNSIPLLEKNSLMKNIADYWKSESVNKDIALLLQSSKLFRGMLRGGVLAVTLTGVSSAVIIVVLLFMVFIHIYFCHPRFFCRSGIGIFGISCCNIDVRGCKKCYRYSSLSGAAFIRIWTEVATADIVDNCLVLLFLYIAAVVCWCCVL